MLNKLSNAVSTWLVNQKVIKTSEDDLYSYAFYSLIFGLAPVIIVIILGLLFNMLSEALIFIIPFMVIRKFSGGFHLKKPGICVVCSTLLLSFSLGVIKYVISFEQSAVLTTCVIISALIVFLFSPIDSEARKLSLKEKKFFGTTAKVLIIFFSVVYFTTLLLSPIQISSSIGVGIVLVATLQLPCLIKKDVANSI